VREAAFGSLFEFIRNGLNVRQDKSGEGVPIARIETISQSVVDPTRVGFAGLTQRDASGWLLEVGDILFSHINSVEHIGKCARYRGAPAQLVHGMNLLCLRSRQDQLTPEFAVRLIQSPKFRASLQPFVNKAVNQASISIGNLKGIPVSVPPPAEQRQIVATLDQIDELRTKRRRAIALLDDLAQAIFLGLFGDPMANPKGWPVRRVSDFGRVVIGNTPPREDAANYGGGIEWIKSDNIDPRFTYVTEASERLSEAGAARARRVPEGAVLVTCIAGTPAGIGNAALTDREVAFNQQINAIVPSGTDPRFLLALIRAGKKLVQAASTGSMKGLVSKSRLEAVQFPEPPLPLQQAFATRISAIESYKAHHHVQLARLDELFASVQHKAFRGELALTPGP
jgi:type I restriction enzyme S subunit